MISEADKAIIKHLEEHSGKRFRETCYQTCARWNESYIHARIRTLQSRGHLVKERDTATCAPGQAPGSGGIQHENCTVRNYYPGN